MDHDDPEKRIADLERQLAEPRETTGACLTPEQVHNVALSKPPIGKRGYNEDEVDAFLDVVEEQMKSQQAAFPPPPQAGFPLPPTDRLPARHASARNADDETWVRRTFNVVVGFVARIMDASS